MLKRLIAILALAGFAATAQAFSDGDAPSGGSDDNPRCVPAGQWRAPADGRGLSHAAVIERFAQRPVVLLGESHTSAEHHRWQLQTLAALHGRNPNMVIGFEMFPRRVQPALNAWIRGELDERTFLERSDWDTVWRYDADLYMPLFHFARMHRIPIIALNVDQDLIRRIREAGWDDIPEDIREGVTTPARPLPEYENGLRQVFDRHFEAAEGENNTALEADETGFRRFMQAQLTWDRAMAEALARVRRAGGEPLVVGIAGTGHLQYGHGIPHQLADLGIADSAVLLPWDAGESCTHLVAEDGTPIADAVFGVQTRAQPAAPRRQMLGVRIEAVEDGPGVLVAEVVGGSVAEEAGIEDGDVILNAAGTALAAPRDLIAVVHRQAPGTWLPLKVRRDGAMLDVIARFPPAPAQP